jgi:hypothetical protein
MVCDSRFLLLQLKFSYLLCPLSSHKGIKQAYGIGIKQAYGIAMLFMSVNVPKHLNQLTYLHEIWYARYDTVLLNVVLL